MGILGSLNALGIRIEEARNLLNELKVLHANDPQVMMRLAFIGQEYPEDIVLRLAHARKEMAFDYEGEKRSLALIDFMWSVDFLDHMDTMGLAVSSKNWEASPATDQD